MTLPLIIGLQQDSRDDPASRAEFENIASELQSQQEPELSEMSFRAYLEDGVVTVPTGVFYSLPWVTPRPAAYDPTSFRSGLTFDGVSGIYLTEPGLYMINAHIDWEINTVGTIRRVRIVLNGGVIANGALPAITTPIGLWTHAQATIRITRQYILQNKFHQNTGIPLVVDAYQDSGGNLILYQGIWSVVRVGRVRE